MSVVTPTITTNDAHEYRDQMESIARYSEGVHLDFADGEFAPTRLLPIEQAWRSDDLVTHAHIMYQKPLDVIDAIMHLEADLVILHAESDEVKQCLEILQENGTRTGIALLPETSLADLAELDIDGLYDHVLVFGGHLGYQGGEADMSQLDKIHKLLQAYPDIEIGWDGGIHDKNIEEIARAGVSILNVGGYLKKSPDPKKAYDNLVNLLS